MPTLGGLHTLLLLQSHAWLLASWKGKLIRVHPCIEVDCCCD